MLYKIDISEKANEDFIELFSWIAYENDAPQTAFNYLQEIYDKIKLLEQYPTKNPVSNNNSIIRSYGLNVRRFNHKKYAILYTVCEDDYSVDIIRVIPQSMIIG